MKGLWIFVFLLRRVQNVQFKISTNNTSIKLMLGDKMNVVADAVVKWYCIWFPGLLRTMRCSSSPMGMST